MTILNEGGINTKVLRLINKRGRPAAISLTSRPAAQKNVSKQQQQDFDRTTQTATLLTLEL